MIIYIWYANIRKRTEITYFANAGGCICWKQTILLFIFFIRLPFYLVHCCDATCVDAQLQNALSLFYSQLAATVEVNIVVVTRVIRTAGCLIPFSSTAQNDPTISEWRYAVVYYRLITQILQLYLLPVWVGRLSCLSVPGLPRLPHHCRHCRRSVSLRRSLVLFGWRQQTAIRDPHRSKHSPIRIDAYLVAHTTTTTAQNKMRSPPSRAVAAAWMAVAVTARTTAAARAALSVWVRGRLHPSLGEKHWLNGREWLNDSTIYSFATTYPTTMTIATAKDQRPIVFVDFFSAKISVKLVETHSLEEAGGFPTGAATLQRIIIFSYTYACIWAL